MDRPKLESWIEAGLFASRWLLAPLYIGLVVALIALLAVFVAELWHQTTGLLHIPPEKLGSGAILIALGLIDLSLSANLLFDRHLLGLRKFRV